jgi:hypothetical protein
MTLVLLTLQEHESGIWNTLLIDRLQQLNHPTCTVTLESTLTSISNPFPEGTAVVVNRVSDAADLYKAAVALLECCESLWNIKVWNAAYAMISNKWCHSAIFEQAGLGTPATWRLYRQTLPQDVTSFPLLYKPNAGGFGAGILKMDRPQANLPKTHDDMAVLQEYITPRANQLFRVWFLLGKVQCGLIRQNVDGVDEFTTGCAAKGMCSMADRNTKQPTLLAYDVPDDVRHEIESQLLPLLPLAHCGSVEYLCDDEGSRFYFDLNLLSTLPIVDTVENAAEVWGTSYDPWMQLATGIVQFSGSR